MSEDNTANAQLVVIAIDAAIVLSAAFFGCWGYAIHEYGWFLGTAFGWIPSGIITALIVGVLWAAYIYIPANMPSLEFLTALVSITCGLASLTVVLGAIYWVTVFVIALFKNV